MTHARKRILARIQAGELTPGEGLAELRAVASDQPRARGPRETIRAIVLDSPAAVEGLRVATIELPPPGPEQVRVAVRAFALNFGDWLCLRGLYPTMPEYPFTPGFEVAGVVLALGEGVQGLRVGDEVIGLTGAQLGGHAEEVNVDVRHLVSKPAALSFEEACSLPVCFMTAWFALEQARLSADESILIQTAAGGTGLMAVQLAQQRGARVIATVGSAAKARYLEQNFGVTDVIDYRQLDFEVEARRISRGRGVDVVLNTLAGDAIQKGLNLLAPGGRYVEIAMTALARSAPLDLSRMVDNQAIISIDLRRLGLRRPELPRQLLEEMVGLVQRGALKPALAQVYSFEDVRRAYACLEQRENVGKVVVRVESRDVRPAAGRRAARASERGSASPSSARERSRAPEPVAIIGAAGRFPDADDLDAFWRNLISGQDSVREVPPQRWDIDAVYAPQPGVPGKTYCRWGGFLDRVDLFDPLFFRMSGREARLTDPQQRLFLETCWQAIEDAAHSDRQLRGARCGVFVGAGAGDYLSHMAALGLAPEAQTFTGNAASILASRIAYLLDLKGPALAVDTACSSSLVAIHLACQSLWAGDCELALAGGVFLMNTPEFHVLSARSEMLSPDGRSRAFDDAANGFVPGEGVGAVLLEPLERALSAGHPIHAVIRSSAVNQDGKTNGITAPSALSQAALLLEAWGKAEVHPDTLSYIEAHGTGTALGDPIEVEALARAFERAGWSGRQRCAIGSVKTNIGHLATAAGIAGVLKVILALRQQRLPPSLHFRKPNRYIDFSKSPFFVNTEARSWSSVDGQPRRAAVSSFGFSGTNCHLVLEESPAQPQAPAPADHVAYLFTFSAPTERALFARVADCARWLEGNADCDLWRLAYTLNAGRSHWEWRMAIVAPDRDALAFALRNALEQRASSRAVADVALDTELDAVLERLGRAFDAELLQRAADLYRAGASPGWDRLYRGRPHVPLRLPTYPFERERCWAPPAEPATHARTALDELLLVPRWFCEPAAAEPLPGPDGSTWIVYAPEARSLGRALAAQHRARSPERAAQCVLLRAPGASPAEPGEQAWGSGEAELTAAVKGAERPARILWLASGQDLLANEEPLAALEAAQAVGVLAAQAVLRALLSNGPLQALEFTLVTRNACELGRHGGAAADAALVGWLRCAARELPELRAAAIDVDVAEGESEAVLQAILAERGGMALDVAHRAGTRWCRRAARLRGLPTPAASPWRRGGVFVIAGGAGGIGFALSQHLARVASARLFWIGRRPEDATIRERLAAVRAAGGEACYCPADITDARAVSDALDRCRARWGAIHGVIQAALELDDARIQVLDGARFRKVLDTRARGALALALASRPDELDLVVHFSSFNAWTGNAGQASYSAGCCFEGAFAAARNQRSGPPVYVIDWGYWGDVGAVATPEHRERLAARGIHPFSAEEGIAALEAVVASGLRHAMVIRAGDALSPWLAPQALQWAAGAAAASPVQAPVSALQALPQRVEPAPGPEAACALDGYAALRLMVKLCEMGLADRADEHVTEQALRRRWRVVPRLAPLLGALLQILADAGWLEVDEGGLRLTAEASRDGLDGQRLAAERARVLGAQPELAPHLALLEACVSRLDAVLDGSTPATDALFPGGSPELVRAVYEGNPYADYHNRSCALAVAEYVERARSTEPERTPRILEVGAGSGGTTGAVLAALAGLGPVEYVYTDVSARFTAFGRSRFGDVEGVRFHELDLERDPTEQGFDAGSFDVVVAANVVHATRDVPASVARLASLSRPGGWLVLNEVTAVSSFNSLTFGMLDGWWRGQDGLRLAGSPLLSPERWRLVLAAAGYQGAWFASLPDSPEPLSRQAVMVVAAGPLAPASRSPLREALAAAAPQPQRRAAPEAAAAPMALASASDGMPEPGRAAPELEHRVRALLARGLAIDEVRVEPERPLGDLGVDSLSAVSLVGLIEREFGVGVHATDLFNHGTARRLASYLAQRLAQAAPVPPRESAGGAIAGASRRPARPDAAPPPGSIAGPESSLQAPAAVAIVGLSARFADCADAEALWALLDGGGHAVRECPSPRWSHAEADQRAAFLHDLDAFDAAFFGISPVEARHMDPQQRICLEQVWRAFEDAGIDLTRLRDRQVGVYVGCSGNNYLQSVGDSLGAIGNSIAALSGRIGHAFDLSGPNLAVDTACSSSLVAVHLAAQALLRGECRLAVAAGVSALLTAPDLFRFFEDSGMASPSARCHAFDHRADGFVPGEGVAALLLMPLEAALADGHHIYGVIRASALNHDGRTHGLTAPSAPAQVQLLRRVYGPGRIDPESIDYIEAHGTGTRLGDPIEVQALAEVFAGRSAAPCWLGSVKTNVGHTLAAAGVAGVIKVLLALEHEQLPASLHFERENPHIGFDGSPFRVCREATPWPRTSGRRRRAGVSAFGFSGTNCHLVIEEGPPAPRSRPSARAMHLFTLSAKTDGALERRARDLVAWLERHPEADPAAISQGLNAGRQAMPLRTAWVASTLEQCLAELRDKLDAGRLRDTSERIGDKTRELLAARAAQSVAALRSGELGLEQQRAEWAVLGELYERGVDLDWHALYAESPRQRLRLPLYPFERTSYWLPDERRFGLAARSEGTSAGAAERVRSQLDRFSSESAAAGGEADDAAAADSLGRLCAAMAWRALCSTGGFPSDEPRVSVAALVRRLGVIPKFERLFRALLRLLAARGLASLDAEWFWCGDPSHRARQAALEPIAALRACFLEQFDDMAPYVELLETCVSRLFEVMSGATPGTEVLFPGGDLRLVEAIYRNNRGMDFFNELSARAVRALVEARLAATPPGEKVWILELGAGTGGASSRVLPALRAYADRVVYYYTDLSLAFLHHARQEFIPSHPFIVPALFDVQREPSAQQVPLDRFHLAFASNVLHATASMRQTLANVRATLAPEAWLVLNELTRPGEFATLTFGLLDGWWAYEDADLRQPDSPLLGLEQWSSALDAGGFTPVAAYGRRGDALRHAGDAGYQHVIVAQRRPVPYEEERRVEAVSPPTDTGERLRSVFAEVLELPVEQVSASVPHQELGVDSILAVKIVERVNEALGLRLESTDLFNYPTLAKLTEHVRSMGAGRVPEAAPAASAAAAAPPQRAPDAPDLHAMLERLRRGEVEARTLLGLLQPAQLENGTGSSTNHAAS